MKLSIVTKIVLLFATVIVIFTGVTYYQIYQMRSSTRSLYELNMGYMPLSRIIAQIDAATKSQKTDIERILDVQDSNTRRLFIAIVKNRFPRLVRQHITQGVAHCDKLLLVVSDKEQRKFYQDIQQRLEEVGTQTERYHARAVTLLEAQDATEEERRLGLSELRALELQLNRKIKMLSMKLDSEVTQIVARAEQQGDRATWSGIFLFAVAFVAAVILTVLSGFLIRPLRSLVEAARRIGQGEYRYTVAIHSGDEMGELAQAFEGMRQSLLQRDLALKDQARELETSNVELGMLKGHYENIIETLWQPVLVADVNQRLKTVNHGAKRIWGEGLQHFLSQPVSSVPIADGVLGDVLPFDKVLQTKATLVREAIKVKQENGEIRRLTFTAVPILANERVNGLLILGEDVTDELRMKESLLQSERMAAVGRISSKIAHEVRNPLSSIALNTEMLQDEFSSGNPNLPETLPILQAIIREVERLNAITEDYLKLGRMPVQSRRSVDLNRVLTNLSDFYAAELSQHNISCHLDLDDQPVIIQADENQLVRVFHNLIKNSIEAMEEGGILELGTLRNQQSCEVYIQDTGPGVPETMREKIFDPFFSTKSQGTGLGLAMALNIINDLQGNIHCQSSKQGGARFSIVLPAQTEESGESTALFAD